MASLTNEWTPYDDLPLTSEEREIRVLTLLENPEDAVVQCSMKVILLDSGRAEFIALSYVWGDPKDMTSILVNGLPVRIPNSLHACLLQLKRNSPSQALLLGPIPFTIWADSICINQQDMKERIQQVQMMGDIYSRTIKVLVWLGEATQYTDAVLDLLSSQEFLDKRKEMNPPGNASRLPTADEVMVDVVLNEEIHTRKWWQRLWIRQEFVLPYTTPIFCCGSKFIAWSHLVDEWYAPPHARDFPHLRNEWDYWRQKIREEEADEDTSASIVSIDPLVLDRARDEHHSGRKMFIGEVIRDLLQNSAATNPRDYVYGLLGLLEPHDARQITVDYSLDPMAVYEQAGRLLWNEYTKDTLRELMPVLNFHGADNGFPSWVPDFASQQSRSWSDHLRILTIDGWQKDRVRIGIHLDAKQKVLTLDGALFDTVKEVIITPNQFKDMEKLLPILTRIEKSLADAKAVPISPTHALAPLNTLRDQETIIQTLTKKPFENKALVPGSLDEDVWDRLMCCEPSNDASLRRLIEMLEAKLQDSKILISECGFVGVGIPQIDVGDAIVMLCGSSVPMILRRFEDKFRIVGSAYISGLMDPRLLDLYSEQGHLTALETTFSII